MLRTIVRILSLTIIIIVLFIGIFISVSSINKNIKDQSIIKSINQKVAWIENFYTINSRYPNQEEFYKKFPNFPTETSYGKSGSNSNYYSAAGFNNKQENPAQDFDLHYNLSKERLDAPGNSYQDFFGYPVHYDVRGCPRWIELGLKNPQVLISIYPPNGLILSDLYAGEVYFIAEEQNNTKITLLNNLDKPRIFSEYKSDGSTKIIITSGSDVFSYDWAGPELKLKNPQKIGQVPDKCSPSN
ncbi:MAG: hypothetical protein WC863_03475 [Patescibacteria group bacterium]